ncbi:MAG: tetratricopeptide repeat protein [Bacteroidales bacterium]|nr:tetratricopeptide repeat protein [Bacteroidales bacterium]
MLLLSSLEAASQNNPYGIDDQLYSYYLKADAVKYSAECLSYVDTAITIATRIGDKKGECVISCIPLSYYFRNKDTENIHLVADHVRDISKRYGYMQYYHHAYGQEITLALNMGRIREALDLCNEQLAVAEKDVDDYGIFTAYKNLAKVHQSRSNTTLALAAYNKAINYFNQSDTLSKSQSISQAYSDAARLYISDSVEEKKDSSYMFLQKALETAVSSFDSTRAYASIAYYYSELQDEDNFYHYFQKLDLSGRPETNPLYRPLLVYDAQLKRDWDKVLEYVNVSNDESSRLKGLSDVY